MSDVTPASAHPDAPQDVTRSDSAPWPSDRNLIARCQRGDNEAFNLLVQRYERVVFNFAYRLAGNYDDANDVAQEAFVRAYSAMCTFRYDAAFSTWIFRITTNIFLDERKRRKIRNFTSLDEVVELDESSVGRQIEDPSPTPEETVTSNERAGLITKAIQSLPEFQRTMIVLYHVERKSYEEIAEVMELPIGTVKSRMNRARLALKETLSEFKELF
jgi:RNA polymerase sigma-70 factor (ECF subfamily)